ncbi:MAG TPA: succinate dehydrogenase [Bacillota bacterium]|jgi:succinate dehydrogenase / fumarate reductase cytochrome b subunit
MTIPVFANNYLFRRIHSLLAVVPLGLFLAEHLVSNSLMVIGAAKFDAQVRFLQGLPFLLVLEFGLILLPLALHGLYGLYVTLTGQVNLVRYPYGRNWAYVLQRLTGLATFVFVGWHFWTLRLHSYLAKELITFNDLAVIFANPLLAAIYTLATICALYHFLNGLWGFCLDWGIVTGPKAQASLARFLWAAFGVLSVVCVVFAVIISRASMALI